MNDDMNVMTRQYTKIVLRNKPDHRRKCFLRYWGAIGDYYYCLAFLYPFLRLKEQMQIVLAADIYPRYRGNPLLDLCGANGMIDELWYHARKGAGPTVVPPEYLEQATNPSPSCELYMPAFYYDRFLIGPGVLKYPIEWMREQARMQPKFLIPIPEREKLDGCFPELDRLYITMQPYTFGKRRRNEMPWETIEALNRLDVQIIVLHFPSDRLSDQTERPLFTKINTLKNCRVVNVSGPVEALQIQAHAACHVGVESSQILGAGIHDVKSFFYSHGGGHQFFERELSLSELWHPLEWDQKGNVVRKLVEHELSYHR